MNTELLHSDSYPMLTPSDSIFVSTHENDQVTRARLYAGTTSGAKISVRWILLGLVVGVALGLYLSEQTVTPVASQWIALPGDLFLRALNCLVVPYVLCSVAVAVGDIVHVGKVSVIGWEIAKIYGVFWISLAALGVTVALISRQYFTTMKGDNSVPPAIVEFFFPDGSMLSTSQLGALRCSKDLQPFSNETVFVLDDVNSIIPTPDNQVKRMTLSDQLIQIVIPLVTDNIFISFGNDELQSVITFSIVLGAIAGKSYFTKTRQVNYVYLVLLQLRNTFFFMMEWTIWLSPLAVTSIIAGSFAMNPRIISTFSDAYPYLFAILCAAIFQIVVLYPFIVFVTTRCNPFNHMKSMVRAYAFAFASASSLGTMPVTLACIRSARMSSQSITNFVISIGVSSSTSGMAFYLPIALVFLAESSGNGDHITALKMIGVFVLSIAVCAGTAPVPGSGLTMITSSYMFLFGEIPPAAFSYIAAMDFFVDRVVATCNVNDDLMALRIISENTDETVAQDQLGERI